MEFSWIQKYALSVLLRQEHARLVELCPSDVAANLFSYHLERLVASGYVEKMSRGSYTLTIKGQKLAGTFSTDTGHQTENIKTVIMFYAKSENGYLLFRWSRQPYLGQVTPVYDRLAFGKSLQQGLEAAMLDKLGKIVDATYKTNAVIKITHEDELISHMSAYVYEIDSRQLNLPVLTRNGEAFVLNAQTTMHGVGEFLGKIARGDQAFDATWFY